MGSSVFKLFQCYWVCVVMLTLAGAARTDSENKEHLSRAKRSTTCAPRYQIQPGHTACLSGSDKSAVSSDDQKLIVKLHNDFRAAADPPASNMMLLRWNDEVAMLAQKWADNCELHHDENGHRSIPGRITVDQNIAMGAKDWTAAINLWHSEKSQFVYNDNRMNAIWQKIGHYTAIMWASKTWIGCGMKKCGGTNFHVCDYAAAGNLVGGMHKPYTQGQPCAACPGHCVYSNKLCDCDLTCLNSGTLNLDTCTCTCKVNSPLYTKPNCALNCTGTSDATFCAGSEGKCPAFTTWCPHKCGLCPYGGEGYSEPKTPRATTRKTSTKPTTPPATTWKTSPPPPSRGSAMSAWDHVVVFTLLATWVQIHVLF